MEWSDYQQAIFDAVTHLQGSLLVEAVAGSGKTTTLVELINRIPYGKKVIFLAFNKRIAEELKSRVDQRKAQCRTLHSVGNTAWQQSIGFDGPAVIDGRKINKIMDEGMSYPQRTKYAQMAKLIGLAKGAGIVPSTVSPELQCFAGLAKDEDAVWKQIIDMYEIEGFTLEKETWNEKKQRMDPPGAVDQTALALARAVLVRSIENSKRVIDFDDQLYMPVVTGVPFERFDVVLLDEAQDVNAMQCEIVSRLLAPGGRVIAVGDRHQAIYGFRGAMSESMDHIAERFDCKPFPLSVSYRCPKKVIEVARQYVKHIEAFDGTPDGLVEHCEGDEGYDIRLLRQQDVILCRLNAPLVALAFWLIRQRIACRVLGRDIASGLTSLVKRMKAPDVDSLVRALSDYLKREAIRHEKDPAALSRAQDKVATLHVFIDELAPSDTVQQLISNIEGMFQDPAPGQAAIMLTLSTVHKAKGLEWDRVFILDATDLMPLPWAKPGWQMAQEVNLIYVAVTRAKRELRFISSMALGDSQGQRGRTGGHGCRGRGTGRSAASR